jgi:hypothetical protein
VKTYQVGQVLYVILNKEAKLYPVQVVKQINEKSLQGETTTYMLRVGADSKEVSIKDIAGEIFDSVDEAKSTLMQRVSMSIDVRVEQATTKAKEWYPSGFETTSSEDALSLIVKREQTTATITPTTRKKKASQSVRPEVAQLAAELTAESEQATITFPDGTKANVRSVHLPDSLK